MLCRQCHADDGTSIFYNNIKRTPCERCGYHNSTRKELVKGMEDLPKQHSALICNALHDYMENHCEYDDDDFQLLRQVSHLFVNLGLEHMDDLSDSGQVKEAQEYLEAYNHPQHVPSLRWCIAGPEKYWSRPLDFRQMLRERAIQLVEKGTALWEAIEQADGELFGREEDRRLIQQFDTAEERVDCFLVKWRHANLDELLRKRVFHDVVEDEERDLGDDYGTRAFIELYSTRCSPQEAVAGLKRINLNGS